MKKVILIIISLALISIISCAENVDNEAKTAEVLQIIENNNLTFGDAVRNGDAKALANLYTEDAVMLPPNSEILRRKQAVEAFFAAGMQAGITELNLTTVDLTLNGNLATEIGTYVMKIQPPGMEMIEDKGKYVVIWKNTSGNVWKLHVDIFNTSLPAQK